MRVVIIGGTGNISGAIVRRLLEQGHEVTCFHRGKSGALPAEVRQLQGDRSRREDFERRMQAEKFDAAIDMICFNREDALSSVRAFRGVSQFVMCSTVCTYGVSYDWFPTTEDHPMNPITGYGRGKKDADAAFLEAYYREGFPVTIIKPSTTYGPVMGLLRQVAWEFSWIDRIRQGKPIIVCGDGNAMHQFLHVDDAAKGFAGALGKTHCVGQTYHLVNRGYVTWRAYHQSAMRVIGREVEMVGVPFDVIAKIQIPGSGICGEIFSHHCCYSPEKLMRDVPEFRPSMSLEDGMRQVLEVMERENRIPSASTNTWEDAVIEAQKRVGEIKLI
ncbi:NAD-dependent epimerase/dehydratase family protein [Kamptonema cortianum]|nr:NAD-dependent epimerase/dehydratase family protein [Oscillatoria laete-virens]MDK3159937.1 NAD-dependent epimerase/dehydratase family protein [Kamptonema cortianum]MDL5047160.1 NAD-dependent epimerase/dehydratase family protein [Oscillatoria amoena NRMC-F 0135]MDL5055507.1 NAD-dependent epimerase/dehydratase family protein [Oscillatoria laete-virens NRMC-F 0139]